MGRAFEGYERWLDVRRKWNGNCVGVIDGGKVLKEIGEWEGCQEDKDVGGVVRKG